MGTKFNLNKKNKNSNTNTNKNTNTSIHNTKENYIYNKKSYKKSIDEPLNENNEELDINFSPIDLVEDSFCKYWLDNSFFIFNSINNILFVVYTNEVRSIISYNLINNKKVNEIKKAHNDYITNFRHYFDKINNRDLMISISCDDNNIKLWNINNWECLNNFKEVNENGWIYSSCFLNDKNEIYIITSYCNDNLSNLPNEPIKVFDLYGNLARTINDSNDNIYFIDTFYDKKLSKNYIITGNKNFIKSFDYEENKLYYKYGDETENENNSIIVNNNNDIIKLIESSVEGNIKIWDFHSGELLQKIKTYCGSLYGICLWNDNYLFVGCKDSTIKLIDIKNSKIIKIYKGHNNRVITVRKINHYIYGNCLISQDGDESNIKLWVNKKNYL